MAEDLQAKIEEASVVDIAGSIYNYHFGDTGPFETKTPYLFDGSDRVRSSTLFNTYRALEGRTDLQAKVRSGVVSAFRAIDYNVLGERSVGEQEEVGMRQFFFEIVDVDSTSLYPDVFELADSGVLKNHPDSDTHYLALRALTAFYLNDKELKNPSDLIARDVNQSSLGFLGLLTEIDQENFYRHLPGVIDSVLASEDSDSALLNLNTGFYFGSRNFGFEPLDTFATTTLPKLAERLTSVQMEVFLDALHIDKFLYRIEIEGDTFRIRGRSQGEKTQHSQSYSLKLLPAQTVDVLNHQKQE